MALTIPPASITAQLNQSTVKNLEHVTMRAMQGRASTFRVGSRFPVLNATFAPIFNSPALSQVIQNNSFQAAFPSFNYEDLGITVKATPQIHGDSEVTLDLETQIKSITGQSFNGVPVLSNREYKGTITLKNGETAVVVSSVSRSEQRSLAGLPGLGALPGLGRLVSTESKDSEEDEILVVITPHLLDSGSRGRGATWMPRAQ